MVGVSYFRTRANVTSWSNTLDLDPEWGGIDLIEEVEGAFGIAISDQEAERCNTVGDLFDIILIHAPDWNKQHGSCASSMAFYEVRRGLKSARRHELFPTTPLSVVGGVNPRKLLRGLRKRTGLRLPALTLTKLGTAGLITLLFGIVAFIIAMRERWLPIMSLASGLSLTGGVMFWVDPARLPTGVDTVGDLVRRLVPLNMDRLRASGARPPNAWTMLAGLTADHGNLSPSAITPDTVLIGNRILQVAKS